MFVLRMTRYKMFVRNDGLATDNKAAAKLFATVEEARDYVLDWRVNSGVSGKTTISLDLVEVETKLVVQKLKDVVETL